MVISIFGRIVLVSGDGVNFSSFCSTMQRTSPSALWDLVRRSQTVWFSDEVWQVVEHSRRLDVRAADSQVGQQLPGFFWQSYVPGAPSSETDRKWIGPGGQTLSGSTLCHQQNSRANFQCSLLFEIFWPPTTVTSDLYFRQEHDSRMENVSITRTTSTLSQRKGRAPQPSVTWEGGGPPHQLRDDSIRLPVSSRATLGGDPRQRPRRRDSIRPIRHNSRSA